MFRTPAPRPDHQPEQGLVRWDTTGRPTGLYFTSVIIEALDANGRVVSRSQVTYLIRVSATSNLPSVWQGRLRRRAQSTSASSRARS